jgi:penicillin-binding protein 1A
MSTAVGIRLVPMWRVAAVTFFVLLAVASAWAGAWYAQLPSTTDARALTDALLRAHGSTWAAIPPRSPLARSVVAVEDERFFEHGAVDPIALGRAALHVVSGASGDAGGSTITQQLARNLYDDPMRPSALRDVAIAFKLQAHWSRPEILELYLNAVSFGRATVGAQQASLRLFHRPASRLDWAQATLLAGVPQAPALLDPATHPAAAAARQRQVIAALRDDGVISAAQAATIERSAPRLLASVSGPSRRGRASPRTRSRPPARRRT